MTSPKSPFEEDIARVVRTNTLILALCMALSWAVVQLMAAVSAVTLSQLTGQASLGGLAPGISITSWAIAGLLMGRFMDARGRAVGLRVGFTIGVLGAVLVYIGVIVASVPVFLFGMICVGLCAGTINLARTGAADMYPPERRARGISYVLLGAGIGAIISPLAFSPMLAGVRSGTGELATPWLVAAALLVCGVVITFRIRVDPIEIARRAKPGAPEADMITQPTRSLRTIVLLPTVAPAMFAAVVAQAVMAALMSIIGLIMVEFGHDLGMVGLTMSIHFIGMFGLVLIAGQVVDWLGRQLSIMLGLVALAGGVLVLLVGPGLEVMLPGMFAIGIGWNFAFVGSTAVMGDAARPPERAGLLGVSDFAASSMAAISVVLAGVIWGLGGLVPLVVAAACVSLVPIPFLRSTISTAEEIRP